MHILTFFQMLLQYTGVCARITSEFMVSVNVG